jgi:S1-C subfamily serine protease
VTLYEETIPSVVSVYTDGADPRRPQGAGSGFVYDDTHLVTNEHVVRGSDRVEVRFAEGEWADGRVVGVDRYTDLAVVTVDDRPDYAAPLSVADEVPTPGEPVAALGNPMGLDATISTGVVSGVNRSMPTGDGFTIPDTVQTDAPINPGNSGGPLVNRDGEVVGVNRARGGDNIGFAVSPALVIRVVPDLVETGTVCHATLHVSTLDVSPTVAEANGVEPGGVLVVEVREGPASGVLGGCTTTRRARGRRVPVGGDVLVGVDGRELHSHEALVRALMTDYRPGDEVELRVRRPAGETTERVRLATREDPTHGDDGSEIRIGVE